MFGCCHNVLWVVIGLTEQRDMQLNPHAAQGAVAVAAAATHFYARMLPPPCGVSVARVWRHCVVLWWSVT